MPKSASLHDGLKPASTDEGELVEKDKREREETERIQFLAGSSAST